MAWIERSHSKAQINRAGNLLLQPAGTPGRDEALEIINNWRSCHSYPLHIVTKNLAGRAATIDDGAFTARRIKRLSSIALKLESFPDMQLSRMQDIGGCRAVMASVDMVDRLVSLYKQAAEKHPDRTDRSGMIAEDDYITNPKADGYRCFHIIMKYQSLRKQPFNGQRIEVQIRTRLQHAWATSVETCETFTDQALKTRFKQATHSWLRFFQLMSTAIAMRERRPLVPQTPADASLLRAELIQLETQEGFIAQLEGWKVALQQPQTEDGGKAAFLMRLDTQRRMLYLEAFEKKQLALAHSRYLAEERAHEGERGVQVVLVSADSVAALKRAYPNYYADTSAFIAAVKKAIS